jgi:hypothetical protein
MPGVLALISKTVFAQLDCRPGQVTALDRYTSTHGAFASLTADDAVCLVTVADAKLWLVAVIERPRRDEADIVGSTNVTPLTDITAILATVGNDAENIRGFDPIADSPMRQQEGCKGCHVPMDTTSGFLFEQQLSWRGGFMTPAHRKPAKLYIHGAADYRGEGVGIAGFIKMLVAQPEYLDCTIEKTFEHVVQRAPVSSERPFIDELTKTFKQHQDQRWLIRELLLSTAYRE